MHPDSDMSRSCFYKVESNCPPLSVVIIEGTPKWKIQTETMTQATVSEVIFLRGTSLYSMSEMVFTCKKNVCNCQIVGGVQPVNMELAETGFRCSKGG